MEEELQEANEANYVPGPFSCTAPSPALFLYFTHNFVPVFLK